MAGSAVIQQSKTILARSVCASEAEQSGLLARAHRGDGKRFVVRADDKLTAFAELEAEISHAQASVEPVTAFSGEAVQKPY